MFWHLYSIRIRSSVRDRQMLFWTFLFPLILATFFSMAFANLNENDTFSTIPIAVVTNDSYQADSTLRQVLDATEDGQTALFRIERTDEAGAQSLLRQQAIAGYLVPGDPLTVVVSGSGIRQTILKVFADDYLQTRSAMEHILATDGRLQEALLAAAGQRVDLIADKPIGNAKADQVLTYYYALIAMACLYGGF
ncbi:MAG: ABC transporter permease, partial [Clostridiaceae bacterium]|nr:ABC transporter permease [Clostridiaceae bacterium]